MELKVGLLPSLHTHQRPLARIQERQVCAKLAKKSYEDPWQTVHVESVEDWWGFWALKASPYGEPLRQKAGMVVLDGRNKIRRTSSSNRHYFLVEKEGGEWVWTRTRKKAFDVTQPSRTGFPSCQVNNNFFGKCNIQWEADQMSANKGMPVFM